MCSSRRRHERRYPQPRRELGLYICRARENASAKEVILHVIPDTIVGAFSQGEILQVLLIAILFGASLQRLGARRTLFFRSLSACPRSCFHGRGYYEARSHWRVRAMAFTVGAYGLGSLLSLAKLMGTFYLTCVLFVVLVLGTIPVFTVSVSSDFCATYEKNC